MSKRNWINTINQFDKITNSQNKIKPSDLHEIAAAGDGSAIDAVYCGFKAGYIIGQLEEKKKPDTPHLMEIYTDIYHALDNGGQRAVIEKLYDEYKKAKIIYKHVPQEYAATARAVFKVSRKPRHNMSVIKGGKR